MNDAVHPPVPAPEDWRTYTLTEADLVEGTAFQSLAQLRTPRFIGLLASSAAIVLGWAYVSDGATGLGTWAFGLVCAAIAYPLALTRIVIPRHVRSAMRSQIGLKEPWRIAVAPDGLHVRNAAGEARYDWGGFVGRHVGRRVLALCTSPQSAIPIPLGALVSGDRETIDANLRAAGLVLDGSGMAGR